MLVETAHWTDTQWHAFLDECFASWLNHIDAIIDYEERRKIDLKRWRELFDDGECEQDAIQIAIWEQR
jgi:hypothetical protein